MKSLLVAVDDSEHALRAVDFASELAREPGAQLCLVNVITERNIAPEAVWERIQEAYQVVATHLLVSARERAERKGVKDVQLEIRAGDPARAIVELAKQRQVDAIVVGSHGRGQVAGLLLGSVSYKVLSLAPCTVIVVR